MRRFTKAECWEIKEAHRLARDPEAQVRILADLYECSRADICRVLGIPTPPKSTASPRVGRGRGTTPEERARALRELDAGATLREVAQKYGVSQSAVWGWSMRRREEEAIRDEH